MEPKNATGRLDIIDKATIAGGFPESRKNALFAFIVIGTEDGLDGLGGFFGMVVRNGGEQMVQYVGVANIVMKGVPEDTVVTVHSGQSALQPTPRIRGVVRQSGIGVMQIGVEKQPEVNHHQ